MVVYSKVSEVSYARTSYWKMIPYGTDEGWRS